MYLIGIQTVAVGKINTCGANPADIFKSALLANAPSIVLAHNHPSGDLKPSSEDIAFTRNLIKAGKILRVQVLDHLIISSKGYASLNQLGLMGIVKTF
jgi:DNA repair protein RadC